ncbi:tripartite tricarboxylate transporter TctB family protein [Microbacterium sp. LWO14-1.2]|uniref:tripartite tricarboxylate transporter TctB family protein n=1 Tax=unclassified Microbacterium TaxID=2609290 RepID=UPI003139DB95
MKLSIQSKGELAFAGLLLVLGIFVLIETAAIPIPVAASNVGPRFMPYFAGGLLTVAAAWTLLEILRGRSASPEESELADPTQKFHFGRVALLVASVIAFGVLLDPLGYLIAAPLCMFGLLLTFGARRWWLMTVVSVVLPVLIFLLFTEVLGIYLPLGPFEGLF